MEIEFNDDAVTAALAGLTAALGNMPETMGDIGQQMMESTKKRFLAGTDPEGTPWAPNSPVTLARKKDPRPLFGESGRLHSQIFFETDQDSVTWGSPAIQAAVMQFGAAQGAFGRTSRGGPIPWGNIPARPFLGVSEEDRADILDIISEALERAAGGG